MTTSVCAQSGTRLACIIYIYGHTKVESGISQWREYDLLEPTQNLLDASEVRIAPLYLPRQLARDSFIWRPRSRLYARICERHRAYDFERTAYLFC